MSEKRLPADISPNGGRRDLIVERIVAGYGRERDGPGCPEQLDLDFLFRWVWTYPTRSRPQTLALVQELAATERVVVLRGRREVAAFTAGLPSSLVCGRE